MNSYGQFFSSATHQSIRLNNSLKRSATNLLQYLTVGILSQCFEKDIHHSANVSTKFFVIILFCKSQLYAENYTSGTKQSLDSRPVLQTVTLQSHYLYCTQNKNLSGSYGNTGCGVFKRGVQNQKDFCLRINILKGNY